MPEGECKPRPAPPAAAPADGKSRDEFLARLFRDHYRDLCARLRRLYGGGPPDPEDVAQTAFEKISQIEDLSRIEHPRAFLFRAAVNHGLNSLDRIKVARRFAQRELAAANAPIVEENTPEDVLSMRQRLESARKAFAVLTAKQKEIVIRSRLKGETYAEIQQATGWSQADISRQMTAALSAMQAAVDSDNE